LRKFEPWLTSKNMVMNTEKNKKIEDILSSLDGAKRATISDFFYTRLKAKMESNPVNKSWLLKPAYAFAALALILLMNVFVLLQNNNSPAEQVVDNTDFEQTLASDYSLNEISFYDLNEER
jgi:hypothetical protein